MTMQSSNLLPALQELPSGDPGEHKSFRDHITGLMNMDGAMSAAEFTSSVSAGMWFIFDDRTVMGINIPFTGVNVDDKLLEAYETRWPGMSADRTLHEQTRSMIESGELSDPGNWFFSGLKGQLAEFETNQLLESDGWTHMTLAPDSNHPFWDNIGINLDGKVAVVQTRIGESYSASDAQNWMAEEHPNLYEQVYADVQKWMADPEIMEKHPELVAIAERLADGPDSFVSDRYFAFGSELYGKAVPSGIDETGRIVGDIGKDYELVGGIKDGLNTLSDNMGIDIPDGVVDIIPYAAAIMAGARLVYSVIKTEKEFKAADRTTKNKIQVVQSLTVMSRFGVTSVMAAAGGAGGTAVGSIIPGPGNLIGGVIGSFAGAGMGMYLNRHLQPHMLNLALNITGLTNDDLFYYKNKTRIDNIALNFRKTAAELAA